MVPASQILKDRLAKESKEANKETVAKKAVKAKVAVVNDDVITDGTNLLTSVEHVNIRGVDIAEEPALGKPAIEIVNPTVETKNKRNR